MCCREMEIEESASGVLCPMCERIAYLCVKKTKMYVYVLNYHDFFLRYDVAVDEVLRYFWAKLLERN